MATPPDDSLFEEAVTHAVRLQANPDSPAALQALAAWRARSPAHDSAWSEIAEIHGMTGALLAPVPPDRGTSRRKVLGVGAGLGVLGLGLAGGAGLLAPGMVLTARADHVTATAELRDIALPDGSRISLGPDSAIALDFAAQRRGVTLLSGMIWCRIAPGAGDFRLSCGDMRIDSHAAELALSREGGVISVALDRGAATIGGHAGQEVTLTAGDWLELDRGGRIIRRVGLTPADASAWREGIVTVDAEPLSMVVARIARWMPGRVVIADPGLGDRLVSGVFDMARPDDALLAAVSPHGAKLRRVSNWVTVVTAL
ncbi:FecR domain-containing protein [Paracoccus sp. DMF-8]|uniref:FecR family protein n=1 Tax=Paracoccus sp. DMF-8 TaxID=3019445 RepID=UPI0023E7DF44|nr:FecR domain-containing protein [Paracoccus sp. DMF-8]MDF3606378.1 FecR domain-containing protein [Paracoccus sp. DMF-8]